jgi:hypothetical protein
MVLARITPEGLKMLDRLDGPMQEGHRKQLGHLGRERLKALCELLRAVRREPQNFPLIFVVTNIVATHLIQTRQKEPTP